MPAPENSDYVPPPESGNPDQLSRGIYRELRLLAARRMSGLASHQTLQPTMLVHEAWLRLSRKDGPWRDQGHFMAAAATAMRHILIDHARHKSRQRHGEGWLAANEGTFSGIAAPDPDERVLLINEGVTALERAHPERAKVVVARFFGGLTTAEIADSLGMSERSVERHWAAAKVWLLRWMRGTGHN